LVITHYLPIQTSNDPASDAQRKLSKSELPLHATCVVQATPRQLMSGRSLPSVIPAH
jgi:hypothetical protein